MQELRFNSNDPAPGGSPAVTPGECETASVEIIGAGERLALEQLWSAGSLNHHHTMVLAFVFEQRLAILEMAGGLREPATLASATRRLIATLRTVHHASEMQAQMREIHNEIWYCGERGDYDHQRIEQDWVVSHASTWRRWCIKQYLFVAEQSAVEIANLINGV